MEAEIGTEIRSSVYSKSLNTIGKYVLLAGHLIITVAKDYIIAMSNKFKLTISTISSLLTFTLVRSF